MAANSVDEESLSSTDDFTDQAGVVLGIHNVAVSAPQAVATLVCSIIFKALQKPRDEPNDSSVAWTLRFGVALLCSISGLRLEANIAPQARISTPIRKVESSGTTPRLECGLQRVGVSSHPRRLFAHDRSPFASLPSSAPETFDHRGDFVAEQGAELDAWAMTGPAGYDFVLGYGGEFKAPTLDFVAGEKNVIGNIVGTYNDLAELMVLAQAGKVTLHTVQYPLANALDALHDLDAGNVRGRAILVP